MSTPTVGELVEFLQKVAHWERVAIQLPKIDQSHIAIIKKDNSQTEDRIRALYGKWLRVYSDASWKDVILALEKAEENTLAKSLRKRFNITDTQTVTSLEPAQEQLGLLEPELVTSGETCDPVPVLTVPVEDVVMNQLDDLHSDFLSLTENVRRRIKREVDSKPRSLHSFVQYAKDFKAFSIEFPLSVETTDQFFDAIRPHYTFLEPYIVVQLAQKLGKSISLEAKSYNCRTQEFMKCTELSDLHKKLNPTFHQKNGLSNARNIRVEISLQNPMGKQSVFLVKQLIRTLFILKYSDPLLWLEVVRGCLCVVLLAPVQMKIGLIESSRKKLQFMRLTGIIRLLIDDLPVLAEEEDEHFSFERNLKQARVDNNTEAVQVLQDFVRKSPLKDFGNSEEEIKLDYSIKEEKGISISSVLVQFTYTTKTKIVILIHLLLKLCCSGVQK